MGQVEHQIEIGEQPTDRPESSSPGILANHSAPTPAGPAQSAPASFVYAIGRVEPRFSSLAVEKEFAQVMG